MFNRMWRRNGEGDWRMKVCAGIVTFNPDVLRLKENIQSVTKQIQKIIIVDNCSDNIAEIERLLSIYGNIRLIKYNSNKGIAKALNDIFEFAIEERAEWVLTLDQDSVIPDNLIIEYENVNVNKRVAILCPSIRDENLNSLIENKNTIEEVGICITSGSLNRIAVWRQLGGFDEKLFIDSVDNEYCIRLKYYGYKVLKVNSVILSHELGKSENHLYKRTTNHNAMRRYYIARNSIYVAKKYKKLFREKGIVGDQYKSMSISLDRLISPERIYLRQLQFVVLIALYEKNKVQKIKSIIKGLRDGNQKYHIELTSN